MNRREIVSFLGFLVINPLLILFFQNCTFINIKDSKTPLITQTQPEHKSRGPASIKPWVDRGLVSKAQTAVQSAALSTDADGQKAVPKSREAAIK